MKVDFATETDWYRPRRIAGRGEPTREMPALEGPRRIED